METTPTNHPNLRPDTSGARERSGRTGSHSHVSNRTCRGILETTMKITEKQLLDNLTGITKGGNLVSTISAKQLFWAYRTGPTSDGYNAVTSRARATEITLEYDRDATIPLDPNCAEHDALETIHTLEQSLCGDEV